MIDFEWDSAKATANESKHGISFVEAATAFSDPMSLTVFDPDHSEEEDRFLLLGQSIFENLIVVSHADRGGTIRIISARRANRSERLQYESKH